MLECEVKYVLNPLDYSAVIKAVDDLGIAPSYIEQFYLDPSGYGRMRKIVRFDRRQHYPDETREQDARYVFGYKRPLPQQGTDLWSRRLEIETEVGMEDYQIAESLIERRADLAPILYKLRYEQSHKNVVWSADFFYARHIPAEKFPGFILGLVECELSPGISARSTLLPARPEWLHDIRIVPVQGEDTKRFSNFSLATDIESIARAAAMELV